MTDKEYQREWHQRNKERRLPKIKERRDARRKLVRDEIRNLKEATPCTDCGNKYPYYVMQFDHLRDKEINIADMIKRDWAKARIEAELAKCEMVCANCHAERTHKRSMGL